MSNPKLFRKEIENSLNDYLYILKTDDTQSHQLTVELEKLTILYQFEQHGYQMDVFFLIDGKKYSCGQIIELQDDEYIRRFLPSRKLAGKEKTSAQILVWAQLIKEHCALILAGNFSFKKAYSAKEKVNADLIQQVLRLSKSNPIAQKFWSGDYTWKKDLLGE